jgi:hypothetical protein
VASQPLRADVSRQGRRARLVRWWDMTKRNRSKGAERERYDFAQASSSAESRSRQERRAPDRAAGGAPGVRAESLEIRLIMGTDGGGRRRIDPERAEEVVVGRSSARPARGNPPRPRRGPIHIPSRTAADRARQTLPRLEPASGHQHREIPRLGSSPPPPERGRGTDPPRSSSASRSAEPPTPTPSPDSESGADLYDRIEQRGSMLEID